MKSIKNFYIRNRKKLIIFSGAVFFLIGLFNLYVVLEVRARSNDECLWIPKKDSDSLAIIFDVVKVDGVTWNAGIRDGDQFLAIDNVWLRDPQQAQRILDLHEEGTYAKYTVRSNGGKVFTTSVYVKKLIDFSSLSFALLSIIWLIVGYIVVLAKPEGKVQTIFYRIGVATVLWLTSFYIVGGPPVFSQFWFIALIDILSTLAVIFLPFLIVHFFWIFPKQFAFTKKKWVMRIFFAIPTIAFIVIYMQRLSSLGTDMNRYYMAFNKGMGITLLLALLGGLGSLLINYYRIKSKQERKPLFSILLAYIIGVLSIVYTTEIAPAISDTIFNSPELYTPIILITILPISFAFSIFRYQLMDVTIVVKNTIIYGIATLLLAAIYFALIYFIGQSISSAIGTEYQGIIAGLIFIMFAILFQSTKDKMQDFLTSQFYPEQFAYQKVILRFSSDVTTVVGLNKILDTMTSTYVEALRISQFGIALHKEGTNDLILHRSVGISDKELNIEIENLYAAIADKNALSKFPAFEQVEFTSVFPVNVYKLVDEKIYTVVPMVIKSKIVGVIYFGLTHSGAQFGGKDLELLIASANQAAIAIENARLYQSEAEKLRLQRDLEVARKIQEGLLPRNIPFIEGLDISGIMKPAMQVGGDYFDLIPVSPTKIFVVVGDVSGKGLSASLYMTKLQTMVQLSCSADKTPKEILIDLNRLLYNIMERSWFITMTLALFDTEKQKVTFCRAGHMPIVTALNGTVNSYRTQGIGVGLENGIIFESTLNEQEVDLHSKQLFAFFSDGLTETMNEEEELFGEEKLCALMKNKSAASSRQVIDDIWNSLNIFRGKADQYDDMTIVVVKVD